MIRAAIFSIFVVVGCTSFGDSASNVENHCAEESDCGPSERCDTEKSICISTQAEDLEIALHVIPFDDAENPSIQSWTSNVIPLSGPQVFDIRIPQHVQVVGTVRWNELRVPAEIIFSKESIRGEEKLRVSTLTQPITGEIEADFIARLEAGQTYNIEIRPSAETMDGTDIPWLRTLPPLRISSVKVPETEGQTGPIVWPMALEFPMLDEPCGGELFAGCALEGSVFNSDEEPQLGLQIQAVEIETGLVVSSTALTDEEGRFRVTTSPSAKRYILRISGGEGRTLFPTLAIDPALLPAGEARIRVPEPQTVVYHGSVEGGMRGTPLQGVSLSFESNDVLESLGFTSGSYRTVATTDERGQFEVELLAGTYNVVVSPSGGKYGVLTETLRVVPNPNGAPLIGQLFSVPERARFGGTIRTSNGDMVSDVLIEAIALPANEASPRAANYNRSSNALSDRSGQFELRLDLGVYDLIVKPTSEANYGWTILPGYTVGSLSASVITPFELEAPIPIRGTVKRFDEQEMVNAEIILLGKTRDAERFVELGRTRTDSEGNYFVLLAPRIASTVTP